VAKKNYALLSRNNGSRFPALKSDGWRVWHRYETPESRKKALDRISVKYKAVGIEFKIPE
jgi:hypothetical protein